MKPIMSEKKGGGKGGKGGRKKKIFAKRSKKKCLLCEVVYFTDSFRPISQAWEEQWGKPLGLFWKTAVDNYMGNPCLESTHYLSKLVCYRLTEHMRGVEKINETFTSRGAILLRAQVIQEKGQK